MRLSVSMNPGDDATSRKEPESVSDLCPHVSLPNEIIASSGTHSVEEMEFTLSDVHYTISGALTRTMVWLTMDTEKCGN